MPDRHAVAEVAFALQIAPQITPNSREELERGHSKWREFLPKLVEIQALELSFGPQEGPRPPSPPLPLDFVRHKADGSVEWRLHASEGDVVVNCLAYTRWQDVWRQARTLFASVSKILPYETTLLSAALQYTNVFSWAAEVGDYDVRKLLNEDSARVPASILGHGPFWHLHQGWFSQSNLLPGVARVLDRVHMDASEDPTKRLIVKVESLYRLDFSSEAMPRCRTAFQMKAESTKADLYFEHLHRRITESLSDYLTEDLRERLDAH